MTESEWKLALDLTINRLSIALAVFHRMEQDVDIFEDGGLELANEIQNLQDMLVGRFDDKFEFFREELYADKSERKLAEARVREWLKRKVIEQRKPRAA